MAHSNVVKAFMESRRSKQRWEFYLGQLLNQRQNIALVLDQLTRLVSMQFHVMFNSSFHTVKQEKP